MKYRNLRQSLVALSGLGLLSALHGCTGEDPGNLRYVDPYEQQSLPLGDPGVEEGGDAVQRAANNYPRAPAPSTRAPAPDNRPPRNIGQGIDQSTAATQFEDGAEVPEPSDEETSSAEAEETSLE